MHDIEMGEIGLPDIQRPFVWSNSKVRDLFDSMYKGFPVGYLLFWETYWNNVRQNNVRQIGVDKKQKYPHLLIVDGQQRLTSLFAVLKNQKVVNRNYKPYQISIAFRPRDEKFEVTSAAIRKDPAFIPNISEVWSPIVRTRFIGNFISNLKKTTTLTKEEEDQVSIAIDKLYNILNYPFTALELSETVDEEDVAKIFVRINSQGVVLNQADFILTLMSVFWDEGRKNLERFCYDARQPSIRIPSPFNYFIDPDPGQLLRVSIGLGFRRARLQYVYSILRGKDLATETFSDQKREEQFGILKLAQEYTLNLQNWHDFLKCLLHAGFKGQKMISSKTTLLYAYILYLIAKRDVRIEEHELRSFIAKWFFVTSLTRRYTASDTAMEADLTILRNIRDRDDFFEAYNRVIEDTMTQDFWNISLVNSLATSSARSPALFAYYAALSLLDAKVLFSELKISDLLDPAYQAKKSSLERHHLFPKNYLKTIGITQIMDVNQIANQTFLEWFDNIDISDSPPMEYLPKYLSRISEKDYKQMCYWHALPENWERLEYTEFLKERRKLMAKIIRDGFSKIGKL